MMRSCFLAVLLIPLLCTTSNAAIINVPSEQPTIQAGIDAATNGDTVLVECGTYLEHSISMTFKDSICLLSETGEPDCVIIDAGGQEGVMSIQYVDSATTIKGFTFTGGLSAGSGGGIRFQYSNPTLRKCFIEGNEVGANFSGGGVSCFNSSPRFIECVIAGNNASNGGGVYTSESSWPVFSSCEITENTAEYDGGGGCLHSDASFENCTISGNMGSIGGGLHCRYASLTLTSCTITGNRAEPYGMGGGVFCGQSVALTITSCTVAGNYSSHWGGGLHMGASSSGVLENTIVWGNYAEYGTDLYMEPSSTASFDYCNIDLFGIEGTGTPVWVDWNSFVDPMFCGPEDSENAPTTEGDYTIHAYSLCAPDNNPGGELIGSKDVGCSFTCGDADGNDIVEITDAVYLIQYIFIPGSPPPDPLEAGDVDCNAIIEITDAVYLISYIFIPGSPAPCDPDNDGEPDC